MAAQQLKDDDHVSLCEALDRVLNKGAVIVGEVTISVANIDLIYLGLQLVLTSIGANNESESNAEVESSAAGNICLG